MITKIKKNKVTVLQIKIVNVSRDRFLNIFKELALQIKI